MKELHLTKKDFNLEWFSGQGAGGQHRNKHQNCCRITHIETGISCIGTGSKSRVSNQRDAFTGLVKRIMAHYSAQDSRERFNATEVIRNYHEPRNEVLDKLSGLRLPYKTVVVNEDISEMVEARRKAMISDV